MNVLREKKDAIRDMLRLGVPKQEIADHFAVHLRTVEKLDHDRRKAEAHKLKLHHVRTGQICKKHNCYKPCRACKAEPFVEAKLAAKRASLQGAK